MTILFNWLSLLFTYIGITLILSSEYKLKFIGGIILTVSAALQMFINFYIEYSVDKQNERIRVLEEALLQTLEKEEPKE